MTLRLVSIAPSNTEIICALGLGHCLVGVDDWSDYPPAVVAGLPRLGPDLDIDAEKVAALRPDLVVCSLSVPGMEVCVQRVQALGLPHIVLDPDSIPGMLQDIIALGEAVGEGERARALAGDLERRMAAVAAAVSGAPCRRLYWEWWPQPHITPGGRNWLTRLSELAGGENLFAHVDARQARPTAAEVVERDPEFILLVWPGVSLAKLQRQTRRVARRPGWAATDAVRHGRVYALEEGLYCRPSPRLIDGLEQLARLLHPNRFR